jgi:NitT/TauT family transport system substrate-binding protein
MLRLNKTLLLLALFVTSIGFSSPAQSANEKITIAQYGKAKILLYLPLYVAMEDGLFEKRGLDVDLRFVGTPDQVFAAVISKNAQFGIADPIFTAISHEKGGPGKVVAIFITKLAASGLANNVKVPVIRTLQDLNGWRVSSAPEPSTIFTLMSGLKRKYSLDVPIIQAPPGEQIALLDAGKADIALDFEPNVSIAEDKGYRVVFDFSRFADPQAITGVMVTEDFIKARPETIQKFVDSLQEAINLMYSDPQVALRASHKAFPDVSEKVIRNAINRMMSAGIYPRSVVALDDLWQRSLRVRLDSGELKKPQATDVTVDNEFARQAQKDLVQAK